MAVSVYKAPIGYPFTVGATEVSCGFTSDVDGLYVFTSSAHLLATGEVVYITSPVDGYNGFWFVTVATSNTFRISEFSFVGAEFPEFIRDVELSEGAFYLKTTSANGWSSIHLPIVYKLHTDLWPTNSVDPIRSISSVTDSNGYCNITAGGDIKATGSAANLEFVKITNSAIEDLNGVWQIITYSSDTSFVVNIPYSSANDTALSSASIQYYYNNYVVKVQVWAGLNIGHVYYGQKPYELVSTLDLIPDEDNMLVFSISDILRSQIELENNLLLGTLPNNLDSFCMFFIKHAESYDVGGSELTYLTSSYSDTSNQLEGFAVNSKLPFKNQHSGFMNEYASGNSIQKFLTAFDRPTVFSGKYFDLSFIFDTLLITDLQFSNTTFNSSLTGWSSFAGSNRSSSDIFVWSSGTAVVDSSVSGEDNSRYFATQRPDNPSAGWPPGDYIFIVRARNNSTGSPSDPVGCTVSGMDDSTNQTFITTQSIDGDYPLDNTYYNRTISLTLTRYWNYLAFAFSRLGGGGTFALYLQVDSISIVSAPNYENLFFSLKNDYYLNDSIQTSSYSDSINSNSGVYRIEVPENCTADRLETTAYIGIQTPASTLWLDEPGFGTFFKSDYSFIKSVAVYSSFLDAYAYTPIDVQVGDIVRVTLDITMSGTFNGHVEVSMNITDGINTSITTGGLVMNMIVGQTTITTDLIVTQTKVGARLAFYAVRITGTTGNIDFTATISPSYFHYNDDNIISETKTIDINCDCLNSQSTGYYLSWLNYIGGFDHWYFKAYSDNVIDITDSGETEINTFPEWPNSYGEFADTIRKQTFRESRQQVVIRSQHLTLDQVNAIKHIKTSPLVQIVNSIYDRRTVLVDTDSFTVYKEENKLYEISFTITYTDDVPSQRV